jgi:hypothetical protein
MLEHDDGQKTANQWSANWQRFAQSA